MDNFQPYYFRVANNTFQSMAAGALYLKELKAEKSWNKIAFIGPDYAYGHSQWDELKYNLERFGVAYEVVGERNPPSRGNIVSDQIIWLTGDKAADDCPYGLRRVVVWDKDNDRAIILLTNHLEFAASTIAAIYKDRWKIETFFKTLKQNLKIKTFIGTSLNALFLNYPAY